MKKRRSRSPRLTCPFARRIRRFRQRFTESWREFADLLSVIAESLKALGERWHKVAIGAIVVYAIAGPSVKAATWVVERLSVSAYAPVAKSAQQSAPTPTAADAKEGHTPQPSTTTSPPQSDLDCRASSGLVGARDLCTDADR